MAADKVNAYANLIYVREHCGCLTQVIYFIEVTTNTGFAVYASDLRPDTLMFLNFIQSVSIIALVCDLLPFVTLVHTI